MQGYNYRFKGIWGYHCCMHVTDSNDTGVVDNPMQYYDELFNVHDYLKICIRHDNRWEDSAWSQMNVPVIDTRKNFVNRTAAYQLNIVWIEQLPSAKHCLNLAALLRLLISSSLFNPSDQTLTRQRVHSPTSLTVLI